MRRLLSLGLLVLASLSPLLAQNVAHPLDPLTFEEHWTALEVLRAAGHIDRESLFSQLRLFEPDKGQVLGWREGEAIDRSAFVVVRNGKEGYEGVVDLSRRTVTSWRLLEDEHANWTGPDFEAGVKVALEDERFSAGLKARGFEDTTFLDCAGIPPGYFGTPQEKGRRIAQVRCTDPRGVRNTWPRQIEGLTAVVDLDTNEVLDVVDSGARPLHASTADYDAASLPRSREVPGPIRIDQPLGPGFTVDGTRLSWQNWNFHVRVDQRVGTVVSMVTYSDHGESRSVLYQGHLSEIFVPYMDPGFDWHARNFIDAGEFSSGGLFKPLLRGRDCPSYALYISSLIHGSNGRPTTVDDTLCVFERDSGDPSWRHGEANQYDSRPARDLVVRSAAVVGNYDYLFDWVFRQDGSIQVAVGATGIVEVKMVGPRDAHVSVASVGGTAPLTEAADASPEGRADAYGRFVDPHIVGVNHDHYFSYRLDLDVDGTNNDFVIDRLVQRRLDSDRRKSIWVQQPSRPTTESAAQLHVDMHKPAYWRVMSPSRTNHVGYRTSYQLMPGMTEMSLLSEDDYPRRRAGFIDHHLWVTPYDRGERYAAGEYPTLSEPGMGLPAWTAKNRSIESTDIVLWYTIGMHHMVRAEDWPVMPVMWHRFELRPFDFFDGNPAMDLPENR